MNSRNGIPCYRFHYNSPVGVLCIEDNGSAVTAIKLCRDGDSDNPSELAQDVIKQLEEYFNGERRIFEIPIAPRGTEFQQKVWRALTDIPYGETRTYGEIAQQTGNPRACRAVGNANNKNPIMIVVPCHRVIGSNGDLTGYACGLDVKKYLLDLEKSSK